MLKFTSNRGSPSPSPPTSRSTRGNKFTGLFRKASSNASRRPGNQSPLLQRNTGMTLARRMNTDQGTPPPSTPSVTVLSSISKECQRYQTVEKAYSWPLVANTTRDVVDYYHSSKKQSDVMRMALTFWEGVMTLYCQLIVLPWARSPFARTPFKIVDHFCSKGARLLERAVPRLKEKTEPLKVDGELLVTMLFLPLSLCLAFCHSVLERLTEKLVSVFPPLTEAARDYEKKGLLGQWVTLVLLLYVYLPLQLVSHPSETIQQGFSIPSRVVGAVINWNIGNLLMCLNEAAEWVQWAQSTAAYCFYVWLGVIIGVVDYWYYIVFKVTGLEKNLVWLLQSVREYLETSDSSIARVVNSFIQTPIMQWVIDVFGNSELGLIKLLRSLWLGTDDREELKKHRRSGSRTLRFDQEDRSTPTREERGRSPR